MRRRGNHVTGGRGLEGFAETLDLTKLDSLFRLISIRVFRCNNGLADASGYFTAPHSPTEFHSVAAACGQIPDRPAVECIDCCGV